MLFQWLLFLEMFTDTFWVSVNISIFFNATFLQFLAFLLVVYITILGRDHMEISFYFKCTYLKEHYSVLKKIDLGTIPYYLSKIASIKKSWTLVKYIFWCLTDHMTIWTKFVNDSAGLSGCLRPAIWSFGHLCIFGCNNERRLCFLWFWDMTFSGANKITWSFLIFS